MKKQPIDLFVSAALHRWRVSVCYGDQTVEGIADQYSFRMGGGSFAVLLLDSGGRLWIPAPEIRDVRLAKVSGVTAKSTGRVRSIASQEP